MSCNCKANEQILKLHSRYGTPIKVDTKRRMEFKANKIFKEIVIVLIIILLIPFIFLFVFYRTFFSKNKEVNLTKLIKKISPRNGRK